MGTQVSAPIRIVALVGLLAALAMGAWMMTAGRAGNDSEQPIEELKPVRKAEAVASKLSGHNVATAAGKAAAARAAAPAKVTVTPKAKTAVAKAPVAKAPVARPPVAKKAIRTEAAAKPEAKTKLPSGTPTTIAGLLAKHSVVVVLLYDAQAKVDEYSLAEATLGAKDAGAGFLRVDVRNEKQARHFTNAYGVLQAPTLLVFERPGTLALKLNGFVDHETVEQAALNATAKTRAR